MTTQASDMRAYHDLRARAGHDTRCAYSYLLAGDPPASNRGVTVLRLTRVTNAGYLLDFWRVLKYAEAARSNAQLSNAYPRGTAGVCVVVFSR